ncbi:carbon-nitrogen hydrolase [Syncephalastrum racemosum]|uniref:Carbon-nitrogen hydrolase n=1 Tax=Syncephalastrum racemosum TaxID=13706 RepID=A0A1X2HM58_SYNRA|nr:carbon-nitrogen hydrolase [Syncephalastrum racemosum]
MFCMYSYGPGDIDILVLPEMAFTGYKFENLDEIKPFLEDTETGPSVMWAKQQAVRLAAYVVVGYPEVTSDGHYYNSLCFVDRQGQLLTTYQKTFLFETDEQWAREGPGFRTIDVPELGKVGLGICMDINPYKFEASFNAYEFATYHNEQKTQLIICCMAWLRSSSGGGALETIRYWVHRLAPLCHKEHITQHFYFVACNRTGQERDVTFAGGSSVLDLAGPPFRLLDYMEETEQGVMVVEIKQ